MSVSLTWDQDIREWLINLIEELLTELESDYDIWVIDGAVDCACTKWAGVFIEKNDSFPTPVVDTHPNCRCRRETPNIVAELLPIVKRDIESAFSGFRQRRVFG